MNDKYPWTAAWIVAALQISPLEGKNESKLSVSKELKSVIYETDLFYRNFSSTEILLYRNPGSC